MSDNETTSDVKILVRNFVVDHLEEVHNSIGGVTGYTLTLNADETEQLMTLIDS